MRHLAQIFIALLCFQSQILFGQALEPDSTSIRNSGDYEDAQKLFNELKALDSLLFQVGFNQVKPEMEEEGWKLKRVLNYDHVLPDND